MGAEQLRLEADRKGDAAWKRWGPYLSERQWGTVREDYSGTGAAWDYFGHDQARSRAYRWGEDGIAGISDDHQRLCFALALWNGNDPILKERMFGLTNAEGNHGEDVKECYFYLDSTPTHSYLKYLYKYPIAAFPYRDLVETNRRRSKTEPEYELIDTGVFDGGRYFDVFVEYAKAGPEDILVRITAWNRGPEKATLHLVPTLWFRNTWSWSENPERPELHDAPGGRGVRAVAASHPELGEFTLVGEAVDDLLFTENDTNNVRIFGGVNATPFVKDGIDACIVQGRRDAVNPAKTGTKVAARFVRTIEPGGSRVVRLRLRRDAPSLELGADFDRVFAERLREADEFYAEVIPKTIGDDAANVMRQAIAGMMWSKQFYYYDLDTWLHEHGSDPFAPVPSQARNHQWHHMYNADVVSMPDKWEYPWYAAWDLAFHVLTLTLVDEEFGKQQLELMLQAHYLHPSGQIPAYEWNFDDVNPPVHAWATIFTYRLEQARRGRGDFDWLERSFQKLLLNFSWWVNRKDRAGKNVFEGGFLGLDNIGVFDRSSPLPTGGHLEQADGTAWMALYCQNMLEIASALARERAAYFPMMRKFVEHFLWIAASMIRGGGGVGMWDEEDGFFYDVLRHPDGRSERLKVRSMVGLLPLCAATVYDGDRLWEDDEIGERLMRFMVARPGLREFIHDPVKRGYGGRLLASILDERNLRRVLARMLDENEFLSPYGIRALSRFHAEHPYVYRAGGADYVVSYSPAESDSGMFGGNSNWRGPIWTPVNALIVRALLQYYAYFGNDFTVECPTGSGRKMNLYQVAEELSRRQCSIFLRDPQGRRPVYGGSETFQQDPHWKDLILFYEYFHGDNGAGIGASHQTGWTGIVARAMHLFATSTADQFLTLGKEAAVREIRPPGKRAPERPRGPEAPMP